ncbi:MAG: serine/threonine protein kinase [Deltaproteobacteria bacterium]|nr:serine/threonine protein kinase [Deltaproteobacteria bacterium]
MLIGSGIPFGEYALLKRLGAGGMAEVFLAKRTGPGGFEKKLVIKRILPHLSASPAFTAMFLNEARLAALIDHPNVVHVSGFGELDGTFFLAMEYIDGVTVAELLRMLGSVSPGVAARIGIDILEGLYAIHTTRNDAGQPLGLIHKDIGARNVMVTRAGAVKLLDFGIAVSNRETASKSVAMGTRAYMSPEQERNGLIDFRSDLYSAGVLIFELATGRLPFENEARGALTRPDDMPEELFEPIARSLSEDPSDRPSSARDFGRSLELFVAGRGLEGTVAYLGELVESLAPARGVVGRAVTRLTHLTKAVPSAPELVFSRRSTHATGRVVGSLAFASVAAVAYVVTLTLRAPRFETQPPTPVTPPSSTSTATTEPPTRPIDPMDPPNEPPSEPPNDSPSEMPAALEPARLFPAPSEPEPPRLRAQPEPNKSRKRRSANVRTGRLTIDTKPWTEVFYSGQKLGVTPLSDVELPVGELELTLRNPELGVDRKLTVTIRAAEVTRVNR